MCKCICKKKKIDIYCKYTESQKKYASTEKKKQWKTIFKFEKIVPVL